MLRLRKNGFDKIRDAQSRGANQHLASLKTGTRPEQPVLPLYKPEDLLFMRRKLSFVGPYGIQFYVERLRNIYDKVAGPGRRLQRAKS